MEKTHCDRHPEEKLRFVCVPCNTMICRDCKLTAHEGHRSRDVDIIATEIRQELSQEQKNIDMRKKQAQQLRGEVEASAASFEISVEKAKSEMTKKVDAIIEWAQTYRLATESKFRDLLNEGKKTMQSTLLNLDENITYLDELGASMTKVIKGTTSDQFVITFNERFEENRCGRNPTLTDLKNSLPQSAMRMVTNSTCSPDSCQKDIEQYLGVPVIAEVSTTHQSMKMCSISKFSCGSDAECLTTDCCVMDILPLQDDKVAVTYQRADDKEKDLTRLTIYNTHGQKKMGEQVILSSDVKLMKTSSGHLLVFAADTETWKQVTLEAAGGNLRPKPSSLFFIRQRQDSDSTLYQVDCPPLAENTASVPVPVLHLDIKHALKVRANNDGQYLAVLQSQNKITIFKPGSKTAVSEFDAPAELPAFCASDVCFYTIDKREMLLIADCGHSVVLVVDHLNGCRLSSFFTSPRPSPTALRADVTGTLWIGCRGGEVLTCVPDSHYLMEETEIEDKDAKEGPEPSENLYVNIRALNPAGSLLQPVLRQTPRTGGTATHHQPATDNTVLSNFPVLQTRLPDLPPKPHARVDPMPVQHTTDTTTGDSPKPPYVNYEQLEASDTPKTEVAGSSYHCLNPMRAEVMATGDRASGGKPVPQTLGAAVPSPSPRSVKQQPTVPEPEVRRLPSEQVFGADCEQQSPQSPDPQSPERPERAEPPPIPPKSRGSLEMKQDKEEKTDEQQKPKRTSGDSHRETWVPSVRM